MKKKIIINIIMVICVFTRVYANDNENTKIKKIGIINPISIYQSVPQGEEQIQELKSKIKPQKEKLQKQQENILQEKHQLQNDAPSMTVESIKKRQSKNNQDENQFQKELIEFQQSSAQQEQIIVQNFQDDFNTAINEIATQKQYDLILSSHAIAYISPVLELDMTEKVIERMKAINEVHSSIDKNNKDSYIINSYQN